MGLIREVINMNKTINYLVGEECTMNINGIDYIHVHEYYLMIKNIREYGFEKYGIGFNDLKKISKKCDLNWSDEEILNCINSHKSYVNFERLLKSNGNSILLWNELYKLYEKSMI